MEKLLSFIEKSLRKYKYPNIYGADLGEILGGPNRIFLLSWLYKLIQGEEFFDEQHATQILSEFFNAYGFCSPSQSEQFITMSLDYQLQIEIFYRMFKMLNTVSNECEYSDEVKFETISNFVHKDVNIFRSFGSMKLSENIPEPHENHSPSTKSTENGFEENEIVKNLSVMKEKIDCAVYVISDILKHIDTNDSNVILEDNYIKDLGEFNKNMSKAKNIIENVQILPCLKNGDLFDSVVIPEENESEYTGMAKEIVTLLDEISYR